MPETFMYLVRTFCLPLLFSLTSLCLVACGSDDDSPADQSGTASGSAGIPVGASWHWQLQGTLNSGYGVDVYDIDLLDTDASVIADLQAQGRTVICYFSAGSWEEWRNDAGDFASAVLGNNLDGWAGERWLDVRAASLEPVMEARLDVAADKGCDGVEPDNVDGYMNNSGFPLTAADQLAYNRFLAAAAHERGLLIGLKNDLDQITDLVGEFDFAVNEECFEYEECDALIPFIEAGKAVLHVEYADTLVNDSAERAAFCAEMTAMSFSSMVLPLELDDSFRFACD